MGCDYDMPAVPIVNLGSMWFGSFKDTYVEGLDLFVEFRPFNKLFGGTVQAGPYPKDSLHSYFRPTGQNTPGSFPEVKVLLCGEKGSSPFLDEFLKRRINPAILNRLQELRNDSATQTAVYRAREQQIQTEMRHKIEELEKLLKTKQQEPRQERGMGHPEY